MCSKFIDECSDLEGNISAEKIIHMDINGSREVRFAVGWILGTITKYVFETRKSGRPPSLESLKSILSHNYNTFLSLSKKIPRYKKVTQLLGIII